jgi:hypothetical protein
VCHVCIVGWLQLIVNLPQEEVFDYMLRIAGPLVASELQEHLGEHLNVRQLLVGATLSMSA